jgi:DnaJ-class molecular chaperone
MFSTATASSNDKHYKTLGVSKMASDSEIKKAYRKLAVQHHPDKGGDPDTFKNIGQAYQILSDPEKRRMYDQFGDDAPNMNMGGASPEDIFAQFFGGAGGAPFGMGGMGMNMGGMRRKPQKMEHDINLSLKQIYLGKKIRTSVPNVVKCDTCGGSGHAMRQVRFGPMVTQAMEPCQSCGGAGMYPGDTTTSVEFKIPRGIEHNNLIEKDGIRMRVKQKPHDIFKRLGKHIVMEKTITLVEALVGVALEIPHLDGTTEAVHVDNVIRPKSTYRLPNRGMVASTGPPGDLYVLFDVLFPTSVVDRDAIAAQLGHTIPPRPSNSKRLVEATMPKSRSTAAATDNAASQHGDDGPNGCAQQ